MFTHNPFIYPKSETCTLDVIDSCSSLHHNDQDAMVACREGARDAYLHSSLGQGAATRNGQMGAYASGFYSTNVLCGGVYSAHTPFAVGLYEYATPPVHIQRVPMLWNVW